MGGARRAKSFWRVVLGHAEWTKPRAGRRRQNMHPETLKNQPPASMANEGMIEERDLKTSASNISDNTHTGEHWDGPKRGRIIRDYRKALDECNISGTGKCTQAALKDQHK